MNKIKIKENSVMQTLLIPLWGKDIAYKLYPEFFYNNNCEKIFNSIDASLKKQSSFKSKLGGIIAGSRQYNLIESCKNYLNKNENANIINLGCGLDISFSLINSKKSKGYNVDFKDVIDIRNNLIKKEENEINIASNILDTTWFDKIENKESSVFFASGVFYYLTEEQVSNLIFKICDNFKKGKIVFDATNSKGLKKMKRTWLKSTGMEKVNLYYEVNNISKIYSYSPRIKKVVKKGGVTGFRELSKKYGFITNLILRKAEKMNLSQIIEIYFD